MHRGFGDPLPFEHANRNVPNSNLSFPCRLLRQVMEADSRLSDDHRINSAERSSSERSARRPGTSFSLFIAPHLRAMSILLREGAANSTVGVIQDSGWFTPKTGAGEGGPDDAASE
jgi:hypothetical protein